MGKRRGRGRAKGGGGGGKPRGRGRGKRADGGGGKPAGAGGGKRGGGRGGALAEWGRSLIAAFVIFLVLRIFLLETYVIDSGSMEETLLVGDFLAVNKLALGPRIPFTDLRVPGYSEPRRGDILVFDPHHEENMTIVKRVVGMPGDTLEMRDKVLHLNGEAHDEPYAATMGPRDRHHPDMLWQNEFLVGGAGAGEDYRGTWDNWGPLAVPAGHYFMLGDNRDDSIDSRQWGFLEGWRFKGRVAFIYFSYDRDSFRPFPWITEVRGGRIGDRVR